MTTGLEDRKYWVEMLSRIAAPVLAALAQRKLRATMPVEAVEGWEQDRRPYTHLEALGRVLAGIAPWIELAEGGTGDVAEAQARGHFAELARLSIEAAVEPGSPDYMNFTEGEQVIVDSAFVAHSLIRAPQQLYRSLSEKTKTHLVTSFEQTRAQEPVMNNHLLFAAIIEVALARMGQKWDRARLDFAIQHHMDWYKGDGVYGDGPEFRWDYYNSFVTQPMLLDILDTIGEVSKEWDELKAPVLKRAIRYAAIQERFIAPDGTFPPIGRSLTYRTGAFQLLGQMALRHQLPENVKPAQVRCAMTAMIRRVMEPPGTFDKDGWLTIGMCGHQPGLGEYYISTGSNYLCAVGFLPLGLPANDPFWSDPPADWTSKAVWAGVDMLCDHAI